MIILGLYLSLRGYHSFDSDQAYRLPLLLHRQDPTLFAADPFVRAFDVFNPHRGTLLVLDLVTRPLGLCGGAPARFRSDLCWDVPWCRSADAGSLARSGSSGGMAAVGLILAAKAGNIGTNHLFEAMVLDRLMAFAIGWLALAAGHRRAEPGTLGCHRRRRRGDRDSSLGRAPARTCAGGKLDRLGPDRQIDEFQPVRRFLRNCRPGDCRATWPGAQPGGR